MIWHKFDATDESTWPPLSTDVLVVRKVWNGRIIRRGYLSANYKKAFCVEGDIIPVGEITHWRPMPDLPVEGYENIEDLIRQFKEAGLFADAGKKDENGATCKQCLQVAAVSQEMSAREYLNARWLMCLIYDNCEGCPFCESWEDFSEEPILCYSTERIATDYAVAIVERWAREHAKEIEEAYDV